ncbi:MAG: hypothetical protein N2Z74_08405, partial [Syntrophales bacterium]|nr:hypothetical protein [Syntrophales bacterium]
MIADAILKVAAQVAQERGGQPYRPRPSLSGPERCARQIYYMAINAPQKPLAERMVIVLDDSSYHEELTAKWIAYTSFNLHSRQMKVPTVEVMWKGQPYTMVGHIDGIVTDIAGVDRLFEHKACNHFTFLRYLKGKEPPLDYFTQCALYITGLAKLRKDHITECILLVKNKNSGAYLEYYLSYDVNEDRLDIIHIMGSDGTYVELPDNTVYGLVQNTIKKFNYIDECIRNSSPPA